MTKEQAEQVWNQIGGDLAHAARLAVEPGPAPVKGKPIKEVRIEFITEIVKLAFVSGLQSGFERGQRAAGIDLASENGCPNDDDATDIGGEG